MYHNHVDKDYSHPWYTPDKMVKPEFELARLMEKNSWLRALFPFFGWAVYLWGMPDGSHFVPFSFTGKENNRIWNESKQIRGDYQDHINCVISSSWVFVNAYAILTVCQWNWSTFAYYYLAPALVYGWWLVTVTYLQHHDHTTEVFDSKDWNFVYSAFQTIDRKFGFGIDKLHHHISDGHIAHHLFFKAIPHYNLPIATKAIYDYMNENKLGHMVKTDDTRDFYFRVHKYFVEFGFGAKLFKAETVKSKQ
jgi:omega-3 fatty acid desaturase (delta-15 desaturase)